MIETLGPYIKLFEKPFQAIGFQYAGRFKDNDHFDTYSNGRYKMVLCVGCGFIKVYEGRTALPTAKGYFRSYYKSEQMEEYLKKKFKFSPDGEITIVEPNKIYGNL